MKSRVNKLMKECKFLAADLLTRQLVDSFTDHLKDD